jgi:hypothetical protein
VGRPPSLHPPDTKDQTLSSELHGEALFAAKQLELQPSIDHLREVAQDRGYIRTECVGTSPVPGSRALHGEVKTS